MNTSKMKKLLMADRRHTDMEFTEALVFETLHPKTSFALFEDKLLARFWKIRGVSVADLREFGEPEGVLEAQALFKRAFPNCSCSFAAAKGTLSEMRFDRVYQFEPEYIQLQDLTIEANNFLKTVDGYDRRKKLRYTDSE